MQDEVATIANALEQTHAALELARVRPAHDIREGLAQRLLRKRQHVMMKRDDTQCIGGSSVERTVDRFHVIGGEHSMPVQPLTIVRSGGVDADDVQAVAARRLHTLAGHDAIADIVTEPVVVAWNDRDASRIDERREGPLVVIELVMPAAVREVPSDDDMIDTGGRECLGNGTRNRRIAVSGTKVQVGHVS